MTISLKSSKVRSFQVVMEVYQKSKERISGSRVVVVQKLCSLAMCDDTLDLCVLWLSLHQIDFC